MGRIIGASPAPAGVTQQVSIGGVTAVFRSGANYKAVGELVQRSLYQALSSAFPRTGAFSSANVTLPTANLWNSVTYGNGVFVAVGSYNASATNTFAISKDGKTWSQVIVPQSAIWTSVAFGNNQFCAFGNDGSGTTYLLTSTNGVNWTQRSAPNFAPNHGCVAWNGSIFAGVQPGNSQAFSSTDGITWTPRVMPASTSWIGVAWCAGAAKFVAISNGATQGATSPDGITWTSRTLPASTMKGIAANGTTLAAVTGGPGTASALYTSTDGIVWTARTVPGSTFAANVIVWGDGVFITSGKDPSTVLVSYDGANWTEKTIVSGGTGNIWSSSAFGAGMFLGLYTGQQTGGTNGQVMYAENLTDSDYLYLSGTAGSFVRVA